MSTTYWPHIYYHYGNWHCHFHSSLWPRGLGNTPHEAYFDWERRWKLERGL
jgi:hypothetical protein